MNCKDAQMLVSSYLDEELSEDQAGDLRRHLMDCPSCRAGVQEGKSLARWFEPSDEVAVPRGFSERVARRAFAGDTGEAYSTPTAAGADTGRVFPFILAMTAAAAILLFVFSVALRFQDLPTRDLQADEFPTFESVTEELNQLNGETGASASPRTRKPSADFDGPLENQP